MVMEATADREGSTPAHGELPGLKARRSSSARKTRKPSPVPEPPDAGWSWVVLFGTFLTMMGIIGYVVAMSVFFVPWKTEFQTTAAAISIVISIGSFVRGICGPAVGVLFTKFSGRSVLMAGGLISSAGILLTSFGTSVPYLIGSGILSAIGYSCCFNAAYAMLRCYFKKRYSLAVGLTQAGVSAGQLAFPPLYTWLIDGYGWRGALVIIAAINMNLLVVGALMRPVRARATSTAEKSPELDTERSKSLEAFSREQSSTKADNRVRETHVGNKPDSGDDVRDDALTSKHELRTEDAEPSFDIAAEVVEEAGVASSQQGDGGSVREDKASVSVVVTRTKPYLFLGYATLCVRRSTTFLLDTYGLRRLAGNLGFILVCSNAFMAAYGFACVGVHLIPRAEYVGLDRKSASLLLSIIGAVGLVCRPIGGLCVDRGCVSAEVLYSAAMVALTASSCLVPRFTAFGPLAVVTAVLGAGSGISGSIILVLMHNVVRMSEAAAATGILVCCWGLGEIAGGFFAGFLFDVTGIYDYSFYSAGAAALVGGSISLVAHFRIKASKRSPGAIPTEASCLDNPGFVVDNGQYVSSNKMSLAETAVDLTVLTEHQNSSVPEQINLNNSRVLEVDVHGCYRENLSATSNSCEDVASLTERDEEDTGNGLVDEGAMSKDKTPAPNEQKHCGDVCYENAAFAQETGSSGTLDT